MESRPGNLFNRSPHPIGAPEHSPPIQSARTFVPRADGSMLSTIPVSPEASTARNQPGSVSSVHQLLARQNMHPEAHMTSAQLKSEGKELAGMALPGILIVGGALALLYAIQK